MKVSPAGPFGGVGRQVLIAFAGLAFVGFPWSVAALLGHASPEPRETIQLPDQLIVRSAAVRVDSSGPPLSLDLILTVENRLAGPVSKIVVSGAITIPGRATPWVADRIMVANIPGGIEPGETAEILVPIENDTAMWFQPFRPATGELTVRASQAFGPSGDLVFSAPDFLQEFGWGPGTGGTSK